jgi:hypothetical protein
VLLYRFSYGFRLYAPSAGDVLVSIQVIVVTPFLLGEPIEKKKEFRHRNGASIL